MVQVVCETDYSMSEALCMHVCTHAEALSTH